MASSPWQPATIRSTSSSLAAVAALLVAVVLPARADDGASIERGRAMARVLLLFRQPGYCAIALAHDRCRADVDAFLAGRGDDAFSSIPKIGPHPASGLRAFVNDGDRDGFDPALVYVNSISATPAMWAADSRDAALYDAGIDEVFVRAARGNSVAEMLGLGAVLDLSVHLASIPSGALPVSLDGLRPVTAGSETQPVTGNLAVAIALGDAVDRLAPSKPLAILSFSDDPRGDAVLGVAATTVTELIDNPDWLAQPDAQRFVEAFVARLLVLRPGARDELDRLRSLLRAGPGFDHAATLKAATDVMLPLLGLGKPHNVGILAGALAAQFAYNAAILRDPALQSATLGIVAESDLLDGTVSGWAAARAQAAGIDPADWSDQFHYGLHLVDLIVKGSTT